MQIRINGKTLQERIFPILSSSKLDFYGCVYKIQAHALLADLLNYSSDRSTLTKLRLSAHKLNIEKGRYSYIPRKNKIGTVCSTTSVENEIHFLSECSAYSKERDGLFMKLKQVSDRFNQKIINVYHIYHVLKVRM